MAFNNNSLPLPPPFFLSLAPSRFFPCTPLIPVPEDGVELCVEASDPHLGEVPVRVDDLGPLNLPERDS